MIIRLPKFRRNEYDINAGNYVSAATRPLNSGLRIINRENRAIRDLRLLAASRQIGIKNLLRSAFFVSQYECPEQFGRRGLA